MRTVAIKDIFSTWRSALLILTLLIGVIALLAYEENRSSSKIDSLIEQEQLIDAIASIGREDLGLANIQLHGKSEMLALLDKRLRTLQEHDPLAYLFTNDSDAYRKDLASLQTKELAFIELAKAWYAIDDADLESKVSRMLAAKRELREHIHTMLLKEHAYERKRTDLRQGLIYLTLLFMLSFLILFIRRSSMVLRDIDSLFMVNTSGEAYVPFTEEVSAITRRLNRRNGSDDDPAYTDQTTGIHNLKGLIHAYTNKRGPKEGVYIAVALFEIDALDTSQGERSDDLTNTLLKKIAFILTLYTRSADIIARSDDTQFTVIFNRNDRNQVIKDCELIMESVKETTLKGADEEGLSVTLSAGVASKHSSVSLDETITLAKKALSKAKAAGTGRLVQT